MWHFPPSAYQWHLCNKHNIYDLVTHSRQFFCAVNVVNWITCLLVLCFSADMKCPVCHKMVPSDDVECHLVMCLTKPRVNYNGNSPGMFPTVCLFLDCAIIMLLDVEILCWCLVSDENIIIAYINYYYFIYKKKYKRCNV